MDPCKVDPAAMAAANANAFAALLAGLEELVHQALGHVLPKDVPIFARAARMIAPMWGKGLSNATTSGNLKSPIN